MMGIQNRRDSKDFERRSLSTNGGKRYPFTFSEKNSGIGYFSLNMDWMKKDFLKENTGYFCLVR
jgi:hypothetical protein